MRFPPRKYCGKLLFLLYEEVMPLHCSSSCYNWKPFVSSNYWAAKTGKDHRNHRRQPCPLTGDQTKTKREHMLGELLGMAAKTENWHNQEVLVVRMSTQATWLLLWTRSILYNTGARSDSPQLLNRRHLQSSLLGCWKVEFLKLSWFYCSFKKKGNFFQRLIAGSETSSPSDGFTSWEAIFLYFICNSLC